MNSKLALQNCLGVSLRLWWVVQPKLLSQTAFCDGRLVKPGITACKARVLMLFEGAILDLMRLNFLFVIRSLLVVLLAPVWNGVAFFEFCTAIHHGRLSAYQRPSQGAFLHPLPQPRDAKSAHLARQRHTETHK